MERGVFKVAANREEREGCLKWQHIERREGNREKTERWREGCLKWQQIERREGNREKRERDGERGV